MINNNYLCHCKKFIMNFNMFVTLNIVNANIKFFVQVNIVQSIDIYIYKMNTNTGRDVGS